MKYLVIVSSILVSFSSWAVTANNFGSWSLLCNDSSVCTLSQVVAKDKKATKVLLGVNVDYSYSKSFPVLIIKLPQNTITKNGVGVKIDEFAPLQVPFSGCDEKACQSIIKIDSQLLEQMHNGETMLIAFQKSESQQVTLPVSLAGFDEAYAQLTSRVKR
ncbi:invasion protein [Alteromonas mediterranea]|uniref:invasion associated locus B family protein n=1 Tax=Alteromonas mediterranea TaxID=314275 RepID=UPI000903BF35|nr:invasion associated locus B family protein [Alteromonas mediterranea]APD94521.1 invasion protein [Alteromonas mediterranea]APD98153.1 invasion protein [Alteromonas mediterranea]QGX62273.1 invasion associated locus B family protein [Alteromonas mediterranea]